ncbi:MAG: hypothetical protein JO022_06655 [Acidobacteriaceae bacterium]|nr:hypothetical protein [Acidobacteriaceae bacterium]
MKLNTIGIILFLIAICGCSKQAASGNQPATLTLKDGTTVAGTVTKSDTASITLQTSNGVVTTYPMSQVSAVNYGSPVTTNAAPGTTPSQQPQAAPPASDASTAAGSDSSTAPSTTPPAASSAERQYTPSESFATVPAGTTIAVRTDQTIDSRTADIGQNFPGVVARDVRDSNGRVAVPRGAQATLIVRAARAQGKVEGRSELVLDVAAVRIQARQYRLETKDFVERGREGVGANERTSKFAGGGGLLGTIVGAVAGGGKGAAIGALSGAAAGTAAQTASRGKGVVIPAERS